MAAGHFILFSVREPEILKAADSDTWKLMDDILL